MILVFLILAFCCCLLFLVGFCLIVDICSFDSFALYTINLL